MRTYVLLLCSLLCWRSYGQGEAISADLPKLSPPSPTVAAFMKFEETPVSNYTGTPNISIPLFSTATRNKDIAVSLSLNYHPGSAIPTEVASNVGLGWSFFGGGTISRTVRGLPDEFNDGTHVGMYEQGTQYDAFVSAAANNSSISQLSDALKTYAYAAGIKNYYDSQYDLYQYNFMGYSGRFYLNKDKQVVKLDNSTLLILFDPSAQSFTVRDDKGNRFVFDVKEITTESGLTSTTYLEGSQDSPSPQYTYPSAYHLSNVLDVNDKLLVTYYYNPDNVIIPENTHSVTATTINMTSTDPNTVLQIINNSSCNNKEEMIHDLEPLEILAGKDLSVKTKKLTGICVWGKAKIQILSETGRSDYNLLNGENASKIKQVIVSTYNTQPIGYAGDTRIKKYTLEYTYSNVADHGKRLLLTSVAEGNFENNEQLTTRMFYNDYYTQLSYGQPDIGKDYWGFYNATPFSDRTNRETSPLLCSTEMLQKMVLPTGGCVIYDFEPNTYSYIGSYALQDYDADPETSEFNPNPDNWNIEQSLSPTIGANQEYSLGSSIYYRIAVIRPNNPFIGTGSLRWYRGTTNLGAMDCTGCTLTRPMLPNQTYKIRYEWLNSSYTGSASVLISIKSRKTPTRKWLYGGGVRIRRIGYFSDSNVPQYHYITGSTEVPAKEKNYNYQFFDDPMRSSGSLAFPKPVYDYTLTKKHGIYCKDYGQVSFPPSYTYAYHTSFNNLSPLRTQGADVGYKNITITQTGLGSQQFTYLTAADYPEENTGQEEDYTLSYPFLPSVNYDYKRGYELRSQTYDQAGKLLTETISEYDPAQAINNLTVTGIRFYAPDGANCPKAYGMMNYQAYSQALLSCGPSTTGSLCGNMCGDIGNFLSYSLQKEAHGWLKLTAQTTNEYFYNGSTLSGSMATKKFMIYNDLNKKLASVTTETYNASGIVETLKNDYEYFVQPVNTGAPNAISLIKSNKSYRNGALTDTKEIDYRIFNGEGNYKVYSITSGKGSSPLEIPLFSISRYDAYSNPEYRGVFNTLTEPDIRYVWGYHHTAVIAAIQITGLTTDPEALITAAQDASDSGDEGALLSALANLRAYYNASTAATMVNTYTYLPLKGIHTATDEKGATTTYEYDPFGRLVRVRDHFGKTVSENVYHYKP